MIQVKEGVSFTGVSPELVLGIFLAHQVYLQRQVPLVVTSLTDGRHGAQSLHFIGAAADLRLPSRFTEVPSDDDRMAAELRAALGDEWDVVLEIDHIHIEHDPKPKRRIA